MPYEAKVYKRDELYELVWTVPVTQVADQYGVSGATIANVCRKLGVPIPGRGYWTRKAAGKPVQRAPIRPLREGQPTIHRVQRWRDPIAELELGPDARDLIERESSPEMRLVVAGELSQPHPLVREAARLLRRKRKPGPVLVNECVCLDITASERVLERALRIADSVVKGLEKRGFEVEVTPPKRPGQGRMDHYSRRAVEPSKTGVHILGSFVQFAIHECFDIIQPEQPERRRSRGRQPLDTPISLLLEPRPQSEHRPNGKLSLKIVDESYLSDGARKTFADGKKQRLEDCLNSFVCALIESADRKRLRRIENERIEAERAAEQRRREREARAHELELHRVKDLGTRVTNWQRARAIRELADALEQRAKSEDQNARASAAQADWLAWARDYADRLEADATRLPDDLAEVDR